MTIAKLISRNYGSIPHLSTSKMGQQADKRITIGQERILTKKARDWRDLIIVTEKIDGTNVGVIRKGARLSAIGRAGYPAGSSAHAQHAHFAEWVHLNRLNFAWLPDGWRITGEWCLQAHGTKYDITGESPFVAFDIFDAENRRLLFMKFRDYCLAFGIAMTPVLHIGQPIKVENAMKRAGSGHYGKPEGGPEGVVYRVERNGAVDFLGKHVRADKIDGKFLGGSAVWNIGADEYLRGVQP